uniref:Helicase-associated domain-containing protein n=1 Tax=Tetradesmus obliquus TaxID=3088 RepID=A0A383WCG3_TETOB|eukprot:jgi/Sobl393_1/133/SZX74872.1
MAKNFFDLLGYSSDELADTMPEKIVQAFHDNGKDGVRVLMYEEMAKRLQAPLHIHSCNEDGVPATEADVYGSEQPGEPVKLIRENTDLYRRYGEPISSPERSPEAPNAPSGGAARKRSSNAAAGGGGGGGGGSKATGPDAWERRFADLAEFVAKRGHRPRRTAPEDAERHLHYWMGQQQRKLGHNELPRDQADKLEALLARTKGKKVEGGGGGGGGSSRKAGGRKKRAAADTGSGDSEDEAAAQAVEDDGDD